VLAQQNVTGSSDLVSQFSESERPLERARTREGPHRD